MNKVKRQKDLLEKLVNERTKELNENKKETDDILKNVKEGLFLIDKEFLIESQYSAALENILMEKDLARKSFIKFFDGKKLHTLKDEIIREVDVD